MKRPLSGKRPEWAPVKIRAEVISDPYNATIFLKARLTCRERLWPYRMAEPAVFIAVSGYMPRP